MTLSLVHTSDPVLTTKGRKIKPEEIPGLVELRKEMIAAMYHERGVGLAAQQIGKAIQICVIDVDGVVHTLINPKITSYSRETHIDDEGCLSVPGKFLPIERHWKVTVQYLDEHGQRKKLRASGLLARAVQHEWDHLNGIVILDRYEKQQQKRP
jgi:peptide deformylase